jgi:hypothetical protein
MLALEFVTAGRALFTVFSKTGERYTFKVTKKEASGSYGDTFFASLLTGPDNEADYSYMGILQTGVMRVVPTKKSKLTLDSTPMRVLNWALATMKAGGEFPVGYGVCHEGKCGRCGRTLTVPDSIETGIGPECARIMAEG